jgi:nucleotide-binding universal stress UspA family protein
MKILCAIDGSPGSEQTLQALAKHTWPPATTIRVLTVAKRVYPSLAEVEATRQRPIDIQRSLDSLCHETAAAAASKLEADGDWLTCESASLRGNPKSVIVEEARRWNADLIVVGHTGGSRFARLLRGSVAHSVVTHAHCSVLLIRRSESTAESGSFSRPSFSRP